MAIADGANGRIECRIGIACAWAGRRRKVTRRIGRRRIEFGVCAHDPLAVTAAAGVAGKVVLRGTAKLIATARLLAGGTEDERGLEIPGLAAVCIDAEWKGAGDCCMYR